ncbi:MAG TPA: ABC transporter ATP-binding protein [Solirubrobacteraceae bacterium]
MADAEHLLEIRDLAIELASPDGAVHAVAGISYTVDRGELLGVVGESGSGKTISSLAIMGLLDRGRSRVRGEVILEGRNLLSLSEPEFRDVRRTKIAMIYQDPFASLHPMYRVGSQIADAVRLHSRMTRRAAFRRAGELLERVGVPNAAERAHDYPHQFSGGMRQRAMIAMALAHEPVLLIADEPTTALDVTVQAQILDLIDELRRELEMGVVLITHDLGVVEAVADAVLVMYAGQVMEYGATADVLERPQHPYTWGLLSALPTVERRLSALVPIPGSPPNLLSPPSGCPFHPRCAHALPICSEQRPELLAGPRRHLAACHLGAAERKRADRARLQSRLGIPRG